MRIEKHICDICGTEITKSHPPRVECQEYVRDPNYRGYKKVNTYDVCSECEVKLPDLFKALKEVQ